MRKSSDKGYLTAIAAADGSEIVVTETANGYGVTIPAAGTYFFPFGNERDGMAVDTVYHGASARWDANLAGTMTLEGTSFPATQSARDEGPADVLETDTSGAWQLIDITQGGTVYAVASGTDNAMAKLTLTIGGTHAGGALWNLPPLGLARLHWKLVATHAGFIGINVNAKLGH